MRLLACAMLFCLVSSTAAAAAPAAQRSWPWQASVTASADRGAMGSLSFDGRWSTYFLLGEPVVNCTARLRGEPGLTVEIPGAGQARRITAAPGEVEVYNLKVVAMMDAPGAPTWNGRSSLKWMVFCDAGIVAQQGRSGFNVAGSPNWDRLFCQGFHIAGQLKPADGPDDDCKAIGGRWVDAGPARQAAMQGLDFRDFAIFDYSLSGATAIRRVEKEDWRRRSARFKREKAEALLDGLRDGSVEGTFRAIEASRRLPPLPELPDAQQLAAFDKALQALERDLDGAVDMTAWREREQAMVAAQLAHLEVVEPVVRRADSQLARYRQRLEAAAVSAPDAPDPLAGALAMTVQSFREGDLIGIRTPEGVVTTPPRYAGTCGGLKGLVCVEHADGRQAIVDAYGEVLLDFQAHELKLVERAMECSASVIVTRSSPAQRQKEFALYSLAEQRQHGAWVAGESIGPAGETCDDGLRVNGPERETGRSCTAISYEREYQILGYDGVLKSRGHRDTYQSPNLCLRMG